MKSQEGEYNRVHKLARLRFPQATGDLRRDELAAPNLPQDNL